jgi:hypothetical protein
MIGNLVDRSEQTKNEAVQQNDLRTRRTPARLAFSRRGKDGSQIGRTGATSRRGM